MYDCSDGLFFTNVYFNQVDAVGLLFRYSDNSNYYSVDINKNGAQKILLSKLVNDKDESLDEYDIELTENKWYRFRIVFYKEQLEVWMQEGDNNELKMILTAYDDAH